MRRLIPSLAAASRGGNGLPIRLSAGTEWTGTEKCFSSFAPAEAAIGLGLPRATEASKMGIMIDSPQEGHSISVPDAEESTDKSCWHWGHLNSISIGRVSFVNAEPDVKGSGLSLREQNAQFRADAVLSGAFGASY